MRKLENILLLAGDHDPPAGALATAARLARLGGAELTVADVQSDGDSVAELFRAERRRRLASLLGEHGAGLRVAPRLLDGTPGEAVAALDEREHDLLICAGGDERFVGELLRSSPVPVWVAGGEGGLPRRILAAIDVSAPLDGLGREVLDTALWLAALLGAELEVSSIWTPPGIGGRIAGRLAGRDPLGAEADRSRQRLTAAIDRALERAPAGTRRPTPHLAGGNPTELLAEIAEARAVDLVVAGHAGRNGPPAWLQGNTAERLERRIGCALLAVRRAASDPSARAA